MPNYTKMKAPADTVVSTISGRKEYTLSLS